MEQSPSCEANKFSASQEIPRILRNPNVHYRIHKCPLPVPILSQLEPVHTPTSWRSILHIFLPSTPGSPKWFFSLRFPHQNPAYASPLPHTRYMPRTSHSSLIYHPNILNILKREILSTDQNSILTTDLKLRFSEVWRRVVWYTHINFSKDPLLPSTRWWFRALPTTVGISKPPRQILITADNLLHCVPPRMTVMCHWSRLHYEQPSFYQVSNTGPSRCLCER